MQAGRGFEPNDPERGERHRNRWWIAVLAFAVVVAIVLSGVLPRIHARAKLAQDTRELAIPSVVVIHPKRVAPAQEIVLPANVQAYVDSPIYARTNGYLKKWYFDIGAHVRKGQLLAEIETPEVDQQLRQAKADLATAQANMNLSEITAERYANLLKTDSVSKQDADNAAGDYTAKKAVVQAARANVDRLQQLQSFEKIYAPFDGVITARNTDIGALIESGSAGGTRTELFHMAQPSKLRVYVNIPELYSQTAKPGMDADLVLSEFPGRRFQGKLVRTANAIDPATRTLLAEFEVDNPMGKLLSGAYAEMHFKLSAGATSFTIPSEALLFRSEGLRVVTVEDNRTQLKPITVGHDFGSEIEVIAGLNGNESVVINPPDSIVSGQEVRVVQPSAADGNQNAGEARP